MITTWAKKTFGDPIGAIQTLLGQIWAQAGLDGMLIPTHDQLAPVVKPRLIRNATELEGINPFTPLMTINAAKLIPGIIKNHPGEALAAVLRPCEMRALVEMVKHNGFSLDRILTICIDCLGTFPPDDYVWRAERKGSSEKLSQESLQFARQGGIQSYRYRPACQFCVAPDAHGADVNIGVLGLPVRQQLTITVKPSSDASRIDWSEIMNGPASERIIAQREKMLAKLAEQHTRTRERVLAGLSSSLPGDVDNLVEQFEKCGACQACLEACPICSVDYPRLGENQKFLRQDVLRWLVSCAGCGMCELGCPDSQPLSAIFAHVRDQLNLALEYSPGMSLADPLPVS